ncbi:hypothetical protein [Legionella longbeachae]|uniref:Uncharacterized protein n=1 Tax=Legionella longbeachae serogroup 1 (strain NSW150) TaxID=661367 RepID=D3HNF9_LEGLN|nr:hypothetical protein [Legionella longbeachae]VEE00950.1 Uncharacterised protein [Legionella oakridgensis]HBD7399063.1 hypothetical protein [Legionella pneumophila]ARB92663.1 hypothetical protein A6J40_10955 [Legionella longbeachae]ARM34163.1 hypothetical protein B0B39_11770 [Legionella longbeachae]EEZ96587.1 hypothetical protein LLB_1783 [Legionella longbeachae D-4968]
MFSTHLKDNSSIQPLQKASSKKSANHLTLKNLLELYETSLPLEIPEHIVDIDQLLVFLKNKEAELINEQDAVKQVLLFEVNRQ